MASPASSPTITSPRGDFNALVDKHGGIGTDCLVSDVNAALNLHMLTGDLSGTKTGTDSHGGSITNTTAPTGTFNNTGTSASVTPGGATTRTTAPTVTIPTNTTTATRTATNPAGPIPTNTTTECGDLNSFFEELMRGEDHFTTGGGQSARGSQSSDEAENWTWKFMEKYENMKKNQKKMIFRCDICDLRMEVDVKDYGEHDTKKHEAVERERQRRQMQTQQQEMGGSSQDTHQNCQ